MRYPVGWWWPPIVPDQFTSKILLIVNEAGRGIDYKYAAELIDILKKERCKNAIS